MGKSETILAQARGNEFMIVCCGEALIDFLPRENAQGETVFQPFNGGSVFNTAIALGRLGGKTYLFCGLSTDFFGDQLREGLKASNVDTKFCRSKDKHTTLAFVKLFNGHARYSFIDEASAGRSLAKVDLPKLAAATKALHFGSISLIPDPEGATYEALEKREAKKRVISLDPNIRASLITNKKQHMARLLRMIALADIVKTSDEDIAYMYGKKSVASVAKAWLSSGAKVIAVTAGGEGVQLFTKRFTTRISARHVKVADTVGAGDTFTAGLLHALSVNGLLTKPAIAKLEQAQLERAATFAAHAASITCSRPGANPPWKKEMAGVAV
jgi:fructokinase